MTTFSIWLAEIKVGDDIVCQSLDSGPSYMVSVTRITEHQIVCEAYNIDWGHGTKPKVTVQTQKFCKLSGQFNPWRRIVNHIKGDELLGLKKDKARAMLMLGIFDQNPMYSFGLKQLEAAVAATKQTE